MKLLALALPLILSACSDPKAPSKEVPEYQTLHRPELKGTFFHFDHLGKVYLACSIHQGGNSPETKLIRHGSSDVAFVKKQVHQQKDLRVLTFESDSIGTTHALPYSSNPKVLKGDPLVILNRGQKIPGTLVRLPTPGDHHHYLQTSKKFPADGMSGSPVFSPKSGTVIGVLQTANSKTAANIGGFELLKMP